LGATEWIRWVPRKWTSAADRLAGWALKSGQTRAWVSGEDPKGKHWLMITDAGVNRDMSTAGVGITIWTADTDELVATVQIAGKAGNDVGEETARINGDSRGKGTGKGKQRQDAYLTNAGL